MNTFSYCLDIILFLLLETGFAHSASYFPIENIALNCGTNSPEPVQYEGRNWTGDANSQYVSSNSDTKSLVAKASITDAPDPEVPYMTARIFRSSFTYRFNVTPGPKFIRLHFYPTSYLGLNVSKAYVSVTAGNFTLLHNFSVSLTTDYFNLAYLMKEFIIHVNETTLELMFTPSSNASDAYGFVNGIEVVSMPSNLYIRGRNAPLSLVGHDSVFYYIYNNSALETMYRINVGGQEIPAKYDTGMFRSWANDEANILGATISVEPSDMNIPILYPAAVPAYTAPEDVYRTARQMAPFQNPLINLNYNLTWFFTVDSGFNYLVRLHFCDIYQDIARVNELVFTIYLNNQTADIVDIVASSGGPGVPLYQDFVVMVPEASDGKQDLWLDLHPYMEGKAKYATAFLNGAEIFKLSNEDGNLAGLNPVSSKSNKSAKQVPGVATSEKPKKIAFIIIGCGLGAVALALPILLYLFVSKCKLIRHRKVSWFGLLIPCPIKIRKVHKSSFHHEISMDEIRTATNNFDEALVIGMGGFGKVYKGSLDYGSTFVAIKRSNPTSEQGALEFQNEIHMLSQLRHHNLVSLLGYCQEDGEMILAYEYMSNGSLFDHLHLRQREQLPLSWIQRLEICIGVARGLHYLHTGTEHKIIHRDIKTSNILLDHNWVAKISDFGLSKASNLALVSTNIKGSVGYLDPEYFRYHKLTEKSDVYSFGVVSFEVVTARPSVSLVEDDEHGNLADWALYCCENGLMAQLVDPDLEGKIASESLEIYIRVAKKCLAERSIERPTMGDVLHSLAVALQVQKNANKASGRDISRTDNTGSHSNSDLTPGVEFSEIIMPTGR